MGIPCSRTNLSLLLLPVGSAALLGVCVAANQILGGVEAGEPLSGLFEEFRALSDANRVGRQTVGSTDKSG
jgi:hypothetical protein